MSGPLWVAEMISRATLGGRASYSSAWLLLECVASEQTQLRACHALLPHLPRRANGANKPAQGNALGVRKKWNPALKGRDKLGLCRPFRAGAICGLGPKALTWAGLLPGLWPSVAQVRQKYMIGSKS